MKNKQYLFIGLFLIGLLVSCDKFDVTPAFLEITEADLQNCMNVTNFNYDHETSYDQFQLSVVKNQDFKDVWVYLNGESLGCWEVPCKIPILPNYGDSNHVQIFPGLRLNGVSSMIPLYPFVDSYDKKMMFDKEQTYQLGQLQFEYSSTVRFPLIESFEQSSIFESSDTNSVTMDICVEDSRTAGHVHLDTSTSSFFEVQTPFYLLPTDGTSTFWEMDFKCDSEVSAEVTVVTTSGTLDNEALVILNESTNGEWRHIYINLTRVISSQTNTTEDAYVRLILNGYRNDNQPTDFYFDNLKIITFE